LEQNSSIVCILKAIERCKVVEENKENNPFSKLDKPSFIPLKDET
jgi:hypothetical protein